MSSTPARSERDGLHCRRCRRRRTHNCNGSWMDTVDSTTGVEPGQTIEREETIFVRSRDNPWWGEGRGR